jgi:sec-independent protein translocase protein TatB
MLSFPHLVVLFVIALVIFGPQKLPELARMLGKATAEFRKMTNDFRYALEDEVRELERQTRIRDEESAAAAKAAQTVQTTPEGSVPRTLPVADVPIAVGEETKLMDYGTPDPKPAEPTEHTAQVEPVHSLEQAETAPPEHVTAPHDASNEKPSDDNNAV